MPTNRGAMVLVALWLVSLPAWMPPAARAADAPAVAQAPVALLSGRLAGRAIAPDAASGDSARAVMRAAIAAFERADDVVRMVLEPAEIPSYRAEDHLELTFSPSANLAIKGLGFTYDVRAVRLLVPLNQDWTRPDWFFYCQAEGVKTWGVYRWRGADPGQVEALRRSARQLMP